MAIPAPQETIKNDYQDIRVVQAMLKSLPPNYYSGAVDGEMSVDFYKGLQKFGVDVGLWGPKYNKQIDVTYTNEFFRKLQQKVKGDYAELKPLPNLYDVIAVTDDNWKLDIPLATEMLLPKKAAEFFYAMMQAVWDEFYIPMRMVKSLDIVTEDGKAKIDFVFPSIKTLNFNGGFEVAPPKSFARMLRFYLKSDNEAPFNFALQNVTEKSFSITFPLTFTIKLSEILDFPRVGRFIMTHGATMEHASKVTVALDKADRELSKFIVELESYIQQSKDGTLLYEPIGFITGYQSTFEYMYYYFGADSPKELEKILRNARLIKQNLKQETIMLAPKITKFDSGAYLDGSYTKGTPYKWSYKAGSSVDGEIYMRPNTVLLGRVYLENSGEYAISTLVHEEVHRLQYSDNVRENISDRGHFQKDEQELIYLSPEKALYNPSTWGAYFKRRVNE